MANKWTCAYCGARLDDPHAHHAGCPPPVPAEQKALREEKLGGKLAQRVLDFLRLMAADVRYSDDTCKWCGGEAEYHDDECWIGEAQAILAEFDACPAPPAQHAGEEER